MNIRLYWLIQDTKYKIDAFICPVLHVKDGSCIFRFPKLHQWLCKDFPDSW